MGKKLSSSEIDNNYIIISDIYRTFESYSLSANVSVHYDDYCPPITVHNTSVIISTADFGNGISIDFKEYGDKFFSRYTSEYQRFKFINHDTIVIECNDKQEFPITITISEIV